MGTRDEVVRKKRATPTIAIIGAGNMGSALVRGMVKGKYFPAESILACDIHPNPLKVLKDELGIRTTARVEEAVRSADVVLLCIKPQGMPSLLETLRGIVRPNQLFISIVAGWKSNSLQKFLGPSCALVRAMPNIAATVGKSVTALAFNNHVSKQQRSLTSKIFESVGIVLTVHEEHLDAVTGLSGSGPAYIFMVIEALIDGGVKMGLPRAIATPLALQTVIGAVALLQETKQHPAVLRDLVTTPGGTTIQGIHVLETRGLRSMLMEAIAAATHRAQELSSSTEQSKL